MGNADQEGFPHLAMESGTRLVREKTIEFESWFCLSTIRKRIKGKDNTKCSTPDHLLMGGGGAASIIFIQLKSMVREKEALAPDTVSR